MVKSKQIRSLTINKTYVLYNNSVVREWVVSNDHTVPDSNDGKWRACLHHWSGARTSSERSMLKLGLSELDLFSALKNQRKCLFQGFSFSFWNARFNNHLDALKKKRVYYV